MTEVLLIVPPGPVFSSVLEPFAYRTSNLISENGFTCKVLDSKLFQILRIDSEFNPFYNPDKIKNNLVSSRNTFENSNREHIFYLALALQDIADIDLKTGLNKTSIKHFNEYKRTLKDEMNYVFSSICRLKPKIIGFIYVKRVLFEMSKNSDHIDFEETFCLHMINIIKKFYNPCIFLYQGTYHPGYENYLLSLEKPPDFLIINNHSETSLKIAENFIIDNMNKPVKNAFLIDKKNSGIYTKGILFKDTAVPLSAKFPEEIIRIFKTYFQDNYIQIDGSIGCPYNCLFCNSSTKFLPYKTRPIKKLVRECIEYQNIGINNIYFNDRTLNSASGRFELLCDELIKNGFNGKCTGYVEISDKLTRRVLKKAQKAGFSDLSFGVESGSDKVLKLMNKNYTAKTASKVLQYSFDAGIINHVAIMTDFPGETERDFKNTLKFIEKNSRFINNIRPSVFKPYEFLPITAKIKDINKFNTLKIIRNRFKRLLLFMEYLYK